MIFSSYEFVLIFLPLVVVTYFSLNSCRLVTSAKFFLAGSSLFFYAWWNIAYLPLIVVSIIVNYYITHKIVECDRNLEYRTLKRVYFQIGLFFNLMLLGYFKYADFLIGNINAVSGMAFDMLNIALPLAISFFTLQQIAFLVDSYEGLAKNRRFVDYVIFVSFFPQLIAGPIVHHKEMMPQFANLRSKFVNFDNIAAGIFVFSIGLFKKTVLADTFSIWAKVGFDSENNLNLIEAWTTSLSYSFQMYFDFSGYSDMAVGAALLFNIRIPRNFNSPFKATGMIDYWKRWHMTLTNFLTTYVYMATLRLFSRPTFNLAMIGILITFLVSGIWHGASWMFVAFGLLNGIGVIVNHYWQKKIKIKLNRFFAWFITFNFVNITLICFRSSDLEMALKILYGMVDIENIVLPLRLSSTFGVLTEIGVSFGPIQNFYAIPMILIAFAIIWLPKNSMDFAQERSFKASRLAFNVFLLLAGLTFISADSEFLYFNF